MPPSWIVVEGGAHAEVVAPAEAGDDAQLLRLGLFAGLEDGTHAGSIHGDRLLGEDVLAGRDGGLDVRGAEARRRRQQHQVHVLQGTHLLIGIQADEAALIRNVHLLWRLPFLELLREVGLGVIEVVLEGIGHGDELDFLAGEEALLGGASASSAAGAAAADQADANGVAGAGGVHVAGQEGAGGHARRGARLQELTPRGARLRRLRHAFSLLCFENERVFRGFHGRIGKL